MFEALKTLRGKVVGATGALVLCGLLVLTATNIWTARHHALQSLTAQTRALSHAHAAGVTDWVTARHQVVKSIADKVKEDQPMPFLTQAKLAGDVDSVYIGYPDKRTVFSEVQNLPPDYDPTARPWYKLAASATGPVITEPYVDAGSKKLVITFAAAIKSSDQVQAVTAVDVFMDGVVRNVTSIRPTPGTYGMIISKDGRILVHEDKSLLLKPVSDLAPSLSRNAIALLSESEVLQALDINHEMRLV